MKNYKKNNFVLSKKQDFPLPFPIQKNSNPKNHKKWR